MTIYEVNLTEIVVQRTPSIRHKRLSSFCASRGIGITIKDRLVEIVFKRVWANTQSRPIRTDGGGFVESTILESEIRDTGVVLKDSIGIHRQNRTRTCLILDPPKQHWGSISADPHCGLSRAVAGYITHWDSSGRIPRTSCCAYDAHGPFFQPTGGRISEIGIVRADDPKPLSSDGASPRDVISKINSATAMWTKVATLAWQCLVRRIHSQ